MRSKQSQNMYEQNLPVDYPHVISVYEFQRASTPDSCAWLLPGHSILFHIPLISRLMLSAAHIVVKSSMVNGKWSLCWQKRDKPGNLRPNATGVLSPLLLSSCLSKTALYMLRVQPQLPSEPSKMSVITHAHSAWWKHGASNAALFSQLPGLPVCDRVLSSDLIGFPKLLKYCFFLDQQSHQ